jgi:hypothetical protein
MGTGLAGRPPRFTLLYLVVQTQGIVGVVTGVVTGAFVWIAAAPIVGQGVTWLASIAAFLLTATALFAFWQRSLAELQASIRPINPTPAEELEAPL